MEEGEVEPQEKEIVWAKIKGFPWWPGVIKNVSYQFRENHIKGLYKEKIYEIDFIGSKYRAILSKKNIQSFMQNYEGHCETKSISLKKAIKLAKKLFDEKNDKKNVKFDSKSKKSKLTKLENDLSKKKSDKNEDHLIDLDSQKENNFLNKKRIDHSDSITDYKNHDDSVDDKEELLKSKNNNIYSSKNIKISININLSDNKNYLRSNSVSSDNIGIFTMNKKDKESNNSAQSDPYSLKTKKLKQNLKKMKNSFSQVNFNDLYSDVCYSKNNEQKKNNISENKKMNKKENALNENDEKSDKEKEENSENEDNDYIFLNKTIKNLANYQIQSSNSMNKKIILENLENIQIKIEELQNKNNSQQPGRDNTKLYIIYKELVPLLNTFTYSKNDEILNKSSEILSAIIENVINDLFILDAKDLSKLKLISNVEFSNNEDIFELITENNKINNKKNNFDSSNGNNNFLNKEKDKNNDSYNKNNNYKNIGENLINIINSNINGKCINEFNYLSQDFFKNIYNKSNNGLDKSMANKRKQVCIKLLYLLRKTIPNSEEDFLKKIIVFYEYKIRNEDPTLGIKYSNKVEEISKKIKNCLREKEKI